jgi:hypothetical protein
LANVRNSEQYYLFQNSWYSLGYFCQHAVFTRRLPLFASWAELLAAVVPGNTDVFLPVALNPLSWPPVSRFAYTHTHTHNTERERERETLWQLSTAAAAAAAAAI